VTKASGMSEPTHRTRSYQFTLRTLFVVVTDASIVVAMYTWLGRDGLLLASVIVPLVTGLTLVRGGVRRKLRLTIAATLIVSGIVWSVGFPKPRDLLRDMFMFDFVYSVAIGIGLIGGGVCLIALRRRGLALRLLSIALLWSVLLNISLFNHFHQVVRITQTWFDQQQAAASPSLLPGKAAPGVAPTLAPAEETRIINGSFEEWAGSVPVGWTVRIGATTGGNEPKSIVGRAGGSGLMLQGSPSTRAWQSVSQSLPVRLRRCYRLSFQGYVKGIRRDAGQFDNCYVGIFIKDGTGRVLSKHIRTVSVPAWKKDFLFFRPPDGAATGEVTIFLSKTGVLCVKNVQVESVKPEDSFQVLVDDMDRNYSFFALKRIDWKGLSQRYRAKAEGAKGISEFIEVVADMLCRLEDMHVWIETPQGGRVSVYSSRREGNFNYTAVVQKLHGLRRFGRLGFVGRTSEGYGVVVVTSLTTDQSTIRQFLAAVEGLFDTPEMIVDLRANGGGSEPLAGRIAAMFTDQRRCYAGSRFRASLEHDDFVQTEGRFVEPAPGATYTHPVICLIGPGCVSSGEGFALMMKCLPHVTLVGQPTRGASGNPAPVSLPNGVSVWYSRWMSLLPDGTPIEGKGVPPDVLVQHQGPGDPTFDAAVEMLGAKIAESKPPNPSHKVAPRSPP
jgi:hypothetical protein